MSVDIFLRSYFGDIRWLPYALRSIQRFVSGVREIIVCVPVNDYDLFKRLNFTREILCSSKLEPFKDDYLGQQADKLFAYHYTDAEYIIYWDSDVVAIRPFTPNDLMIDGKPRCLETPFSKLLNADGTPATPWQRIVEKALGHPVVKERMRAHPMMTDRRALLGLRDYFLSVHKMSVEDYIRAQPNREFSEFNVLNSWAADHADFFTFRDTEIYGVPDPFVKQFWSYSGLTEAERAQMEAILNEDPKQS